MIPCPFGVSTRNEGDDDPIIQRRHRVGQLLCQLVVSGQAGPVMEKKLI